ncbi:MAG: restriction endonuclease [Armatimonadetes bacterium]|nr:restriction endonuclease [Armatimonadota bacterium]MDW8122485.1 restriction endonuclease [Armatimonadota bacterium]
MGLIFYAGVAILIGIVLIIIAQAFVPKQAPMVRTDESLLVRLDLLPFEQFVELMLTLITRMGLEVDYHEPADAEERGVRILARRGGELIGGNYAVLILRNVDEPVGVDQVHRLRQWARHHNAMKGILISPSSFTRDAENVLTSMPGVPLELVDGEKFEELLSEYTPQEIADLPLIAKASDPDNDRKPIREI